MCLVLPWNTIETQNLTTFQCHTVPRGLGRSGLFHFLLASAQSFPPLGFQKLNPCARGTGLRPCVRCLLSPAFPSLQAHLCFLTNLQHLPSLVLAALGQTPWVWPIHLETSHGHCLLGCAPTCLPWTEVRGQCRPFECYALHQ